jgi:uncharacterized protein (TIGR02145 family)
VNGTLDMHNTTFTTAPIYAPTTYTGYVANYACTLTAASYVFKVTDELCDRCDAATATNFTAFSPSASAAVGTTWCLKDTRESNNNQTYRVRKLIDGRIWMVDDLKFGDKCVRTIFSSPTNQNQTGRVSSTFPAYYGECAIHPYSTMKQYIGYYYDWAAARNLEGACYMCESMPACSGAACQGICPAGWHVPTHQEHNTLLGNFTIDYEKRYYMYSAANYYLNYASWSNAGWIEATSNDAGWWSSSHYSNDRDEVYSLVSSYYSVDTPNYDMYRNLGLNVRCVKD